MKAPADWIAVLELELSAELIKPYEWIESGSNRREFLVPARLVNNAGPPVLAIDEP